MVVVVAVFVIVLVVVVVVASLSRLEVVSHNTAGSLNYVLVARRGCDRGLEPTHLNSSTLQTFKRG